MTAGAELPLLIWLGALSLHDLRTRSAPGIQVFFLCCFILGGMAHPLRAGLVSLALAGALLHWKGWLRLLLLHPSTWAVLLFGHGYRQGLVGKADLYAVAGLACVFPWQACAAACLSLELWRRLWRRWKWDGPVPALPGLLVGIVISRFITL